MRHLSRTRLRLTGRFSGRYAPAGLQILAVHPVGLTPTSASLFRTASNILRPPVRTFSCVESAASCDRHCLLIFGQTIGPTARGVVRIPRCMQPQTCKKAVIFVQPQSSCRGKPHFDYFHRMQLTAHSLQPMSPHSRRRNFFLRSLWGSAVKGAISRHVLVLSE